MIQKGDMQDIGVEPQGDVVMEDGAVPRGPRKMPINSHMYFIYATVQGFVAYRNPNKGSWLIESLCQEFMKHAHNMDLDRLVNKLSRCVSARQSSEGRKQVVEIRRFGFDKQFYFNPVHINQLQNPFFRALPYFSEPQPSGSGLMRSAQRGHGTLAREDFEDGDALKIEVVRRVREESLVYWLTMVKEEVRFGKLTLDGQYYVLHSLSHSRENISQDVTRVRDLVPSHYDGIDSFFVLGADPAGPQITIRVRLQPLDPGTAQFAHLCTGERGPSYKGAPVRDTRGTADFCDFSWLFSVENYIENGSEKKGRIETISDGRVWRVCEQEEVVLWGYEEGDFGLVKIRSRTSPSGVVGVVTSPPLSYLESFNVEGSPIKIIDCGLRVPI